MPANQILSAQPFGWHLVSRRVAITAAAVFFLAAQARANIVDFALIQSQSSLKYTTKLTGPAVGGVAPGAPQYVGSDTVSYYGRMYVDIQDTTIQLMPGAYISAAAGPGDAGNQLYLAAPGSGGTPGLYTPFDPVISDPSSTNPGLNPNSNYGISVPNILLKAVIYNVRIDNGFIQDPNDGPSFPSTAMNLAGNNFNLSGQAISFAAGRQAFISALGNDTGSLAPSAQDVIDGYTGSPFVFFGSAGSDIGTWDGVTLTLPVHSSFSFVVTTDFGGISQFVDIEGQLVLEVVPEPATMMMAGLGIVGLLSYAWRARKRRG